MGDSNGETVIRTKGITMNNIITVLTALGLSIGGTAAYKNWPGAEMTVTASDELARSSIVEMKADCTVNRTRVWDAINALRETQKMNSDQIRESQNRIDTQMQVLVANLSNLSDNLTKYVDADQKEADRVRTLLDRRDDRIRALELDTRKTP